MPAKKAIIPGEKFKKLTIICETEKVSGCPHRMVLAKCDCGTIKKYPMSAIRNGHSGSCGCFLRKRSTTHGHTINVTPTYNSWSSMKNRCYSDKSTSYKNYGGKGITVCDRWVESFENFLQDMGERPKGKTLDRINVNGNYEPSNCRWATAIQQCNNRITCHFVKAFGEEKTIMEWSRIYGVEFHTISKRLRDGWNPEMAISKPTPRMKILKDKTMNRDPQENEKEVDINDEDIESSDDADDVLETLIPDAAVSVDVGGDGPVRP